MPINVATIIGGLAALIITIVLCAVILPKSREGQYTGFLKFVRDYFLMKYLVIEAVLRFFFVLETIGCFTIGFFLLFARTPGYGYYEGTSTAPIGLGFIIVGPFVVRLAYEISMLMIMMLKNVMEINAKMSGDANGATSAFDIPMPQTSQFNQAPFGNQAPMNNQPSPFDDGVGTPIVPPDSKICPACGNIIHIDSKFCTVCGNKI